MLKHKCAELCAKLSVHSGYDLIENQIYPLIHQYIDKCQWRHLFIHACSINNIKYIKLALSKEKCAQVKFTYGDFNLGLAAASFVGDFNMIDLMIRRGANNSHDSLVKACQCKRKDVI